ARIPQCPHQNGVELPPEHLLGARWERDTVAQVAVSAPVKFDKLQLARGRPGHSAQDSCGFGGDIQTDAVARNHRNAFFCWWLRRGQTSKQGRASQRTAGGAGASSRLPPRLPP